MNPSKVNELFDTLKAACARQFRFNPRRIAAGMRYVGTEGHGKDLVHVFRDVGTHSQIVLKLTFATLREKQGDKPHWSEAEKAHYRSSDAEIDAEIEEKRAQLEFARNSALYQDHREQLLSHYKNWPGYQPGGATPREFAKTLLETLLAAHDPRVAEFAERMGSSDPEQLAHHLVAPCHLEIEERAGIA